MHENPNVRAILPTDRAPEELLDDCVLVGASLDRFIEDIAREEKIDASSLVSNDDNVRLEFSTPRGNVLPWNSRETMLERMKLYRDPVAIRALAGK